MNTSMELSPVASNTSQNPNNRLEPMLMPPTLEGKAKVKAAGALARRTRVRQSDYLREAVADLLAKYGKLPERSAM